jgi:hypothetical protein
MFLRAAASTFSGAKDRGLTILKYPKNKKNKAHRHMHRPMDIAPNISTAIIHPVQSIMIRAADSIFTLKGTTGKSALLWGRGLYFYLKGDNWEVGASLPGSLRVGLGDSVSIELDTAKPYTHHAEHVKKYPPKQLKKMKKGKRS